MQSVYELSDGSGLVLTVGKYVTPTGTDIDREGLRPDFRAQPQPADADAAVAACRLQRGAAVASAAPPPHP
jgi:C-terminal processing protease CtpA/Prc